MDIRLTNQIEQWLLGLAADGGHDITNPAEAIANAIGDLHQTTGFDAYWPEWNLDELAAFAALLATENAGTGEIVARLDMPRRRSLSQRWEQNPGHANRFRLDHDTVGDRLAGLTRTEDRILQSRIRQWLDTQHTNTIDAWSTVGLTAITPPNSPTIANSDRPDNHHPERHLPDNHRHADRPAAVGLPETANHAEDRYDLPAAIPSYLEQADGTSNRPDSAHIDDRFSGGSATLDLPDYWYAPPPPDLPGLPGI